jgi:hypothetical protein
MAYRIDALVSINTTTNADSYIDITKENLKETGSRIALNEAFIPQQ